MNIKNENRTFQGQDLRGRSFRNADLKGADFRRAKLQNSDFYGAQLQGANFSNTNLQGANFSKVRTAQDPKANLEDQNFNATDFSKADIRGANFSKAILRNTNFSDVTAGQRWYWNVFGWLVSVLQSVVLGVVAPLIVSIVVFFLLRDLPDSEDPLRLLLFSITPLAFIFINFRQGLDQALRFVTLALGLIILTAFAQPVMVAIAWVGAVIGLGVIILSFKKILPLRIAIIVSSLLVLAEFTVIYQYDHLIKHLTSMGLPEFGDFLGAAVVFLILAAIGISIAIAKAGMIGMPRFGAVTLGIVLPIVLVSSLAILVTSIAGLLVSDSSLNVLANDSFSDRPFDVNTFCAFTLLACLLAISLGAFIGYHVLKDDERYSLIRNLVVVLGLWKNTTFRGADLTKADFSQANLPNVNFRGADLTHVNWYGAKKLGYACVGTNYLRTSSVRKLVVGKSGENKKYDRLNLRGIRLSQARLSGSSFIEADLSQSDLTSADLSNSKLVRTNLDQANLENAILTGACIENWVITSLTQIDGVMCEYVDLRLPTPGDSNSLRRPEKPGTKLTPQDLTNFFPAPEQEFPELYKAFAELYLTRNKIIRECRLIDKANKAQIPLDIYQGMYELYCKQKLEVEWRNSWWKSIFARLEYHIEQLNQLISEMDIFPILERLSQLSIVIAVVLFINEISKERIETKYRSLEILNSHDKIDVGGGIVLKDWTKQGGSLYGIEARGANLKTIDLSNLDLTAADFSGADLEGAKLAGATLEYAKFIGASLINVDCHAGGLIGGQNIIGLGGGTNFKNANFKNANLKRADLTNANLSGANLSGANLVGVNLSDSNLSYANLTNADFTNANFIGANLTNADLTNADLSYTALSVNLGGAILNNADLTQANLSRASGLKIRQVKAAKNWQTAYYNKDFKKRLDLSVKSTQEKNSK